MYDKPFHSSDLSSLTIVVTGAAGFIGSHLAEYLVKYKVGHLILVDNLLTGSMSNLSGIVDQENVVFHKADINDTDFLAKIFDGADVVLHEAALGSVPRSIGNPLATHASNATGFLSVLEACRISKVGKLVYASSSSVYGDSPALPKVEENTGKPMSPYAVTKVMDESYAELYSRMHGMNIIGFRYFNIFGPRQNPEGLYAAAIPLFIIAALEGRSPVLFGDGEQCRDFTFVENAVKANILAMLSSGSNSGQVFNIACGEKYSLNYILKLIETITGKELKVMRREERQGDVRNSMASIEKARLAFAYEPEVQMEEGLKKTIEWYSANKGIYQKSTSTLSGQ